MRIIDAQVHVWPPHRPDRPLAPDGQNVPAYTREHLLAEMDAAGVDGAILVPPVLELNRNDYALEAARDYPGRFAVMGRIPIVKPDPDRLADWLQQPGMLGVRLSFLRADDRPQLTDGTMDWFWPAAEQYGLPVMIHAPGFAGLLRDVAIKHPGLTIIYDHIGAFARPTPDLEPLLGELLPLAALPNLRVKVSALPCFSTEPYPFNDLREPIRRIVDAFGPRRSFWGSDRTRLPESCSYRQAVSHFTETLDFLSADDLEWVMGRGLAECLGWREAH